jgi:Dienelactone hydrolase and related enzymes
MKTMLAFSLMVICSGVAAAQDWAKARLEQSPRHGEFVMVKSGERDVPCYVVYPEKKEKTPAVVVIHEIFGLTDWVRGVCDQLAEAGYLAIAPDYLGGQVFESVDDARRAVSGLSSEQVVADTKAASDYVKALPAANGVVAVAGFCWGGAKVWEYAATAKDLAAGYVFYGTGPDTASAVEGISAPIYGFYAENDARVNATLNTTVALMAEAKKPFDPVTYAGAGHGFMRAGEAPDASAENKDARQEAWQRWKSLLGEL